MRTWVIALGLILAAVGTVVWLVPLQPALATIEVPVGDAYDFGVPGAIEVGSIPYLLSWSSTSYASVTIYSCGGTSACATASNGSIQSPVLWHEVGTTGNFGWESHAGQYYLLVPNQTVNVSVHYKQPVSGGLVGLGILGTGLILMLAGLAIPARHPPEPPAEAAAPAPTPAVTAPARPPKWSEDEGPTPP